MKFLKKYFVPITLFFVSIILISPYLKSGFIIGSGEAAIPINPSYINPFYFWNEKMNLGNFMGFQSIIVLFWFFWSIFSLLSFGIHPSVFFIFLTFFLPGLFLYFLLKHTLKFKNKLIYLPACLLYSFNLFRIQSSYQNENVSLLFIFLPLFFLVYYEFLKTLKMRYMMVAAILSFSSSTMGNNLGVFVVPYFILFLYFIFFFAKKNISNRKAIISKNGFLLLFVIIVNLFWIVSMAQVLRASFILTENGTKMFAATGAGNFSDHFRFMGYWAWRTGYGIGDYFPFYSNFDKPFLLITTFSVAILSFVFFFSLKEKRDRFFKAFIAFLMLFSFLLVAGTKGSLGFIYQFFYDNVSIFKMYREPYTKFMPMFIFSACFGLTFSLDYLSRKTNTKRLVRNSLILLVSVIVLVNIYPLFTTEALPIQRWNQGQSGRVLKITAYWQEAKINLEKKKLDEQIFLLPYNSYSTSHNLEYGINVVANLADYLIQKKFIRGWSVDSSFSGKAMQALFEKGADDFSWQKYIGLLGAKRVLVENDVEWRYSKSMLSPSKTEVLINNQKFSKAESFGGFTAEYLATIPNDDPDQKVHDEFYDELINKPVLVLYNSDKQYFLPHFYTPKNSLISGREIADLPKIVSSPDWQNRSAVFLVSQNAGKENLLEILRQAQDAKSVVRDDKKLPTMEFKKINPTKYRIRIHQAQGTFPLIFSESFNEGWKMYLEKYGVDSLPTGRQVAIRENNMLANYKILDGNVDDQANASELQDYINNNYITTLGDGKEKTIEHAKWGPSTGSGYEEKYRIDFISKNFQGTIQNDNLPNGNIFETWLKKPIENNQNHLMANGYANSWVVDADAICLNDSVKCIKNADGSYDFEILVEFWPQRLFYVGLAISLTTLLGCILYLGYDWRRRRKQKKLDPKIA
jgi:hypothetical protein